jgi:hypothetical protein
MHRRQYRDQARSVLRNRWARRQKRPHAHHAAHAPEVAPARSWARFRLKFRGSESPTGLMAYSSFGRLCRFTSIFSRVARFIPVDTPEQTRKAPARRPWDPDSRSRPNRERGFPVSRVRPNQESGSGKSPPKRETGDPIQVPDSRVTSEHQPQWTRNILSREYHASALTGSMRLLVLLVFRVRDLEGACCCECQTSINY